MRESIYTIPLNDVFGEKDGCLSLIHICISGFRREKLLLSQYISNRPHQRKRFLRKVFMNETHQSGRQCLPDILALLR